MPNIIRSNPSWDACIAQFKQRDVFHSFEYVNLEAHRQGGAPVLVHANVGSAAIALPLIVRSVDAPGNHFDATSAYGYNGVLSSDAPARVTGSLYSAIESALVAMRIVCVFNRGHPFCALDLPSTCVTGQTLAVDLTRDIQEYERCLETGHRQQIKKLRSYIRLEKDTSRQFLPEFHALYTTTMLRRNAASHYMFSLEYLHGVLDAAAPGASLELAWNGDRLAAASIFLRSDDLAHYHLSGSDPTASKHPAIKLIIDNVIREESALGKRRWLHLGGGLGGSSDTLYAFKAGFGATSLPFSVSRWILNHQVYEKLCTLAGKPTDGVFFPAYRS